MTTDNSEVSISALVTESATAEAKTFLAKYRKHITQDTRISNLYSKLTPDSLDKNFGLIKDHLKHLMESNAELKFSLEPKKAEKIGGSGHSGPRNGKYASKGESLPYAVQLMAADGEVLETIGAHDSGEADHLAKRKLANNAEMMSAVYYSMAIKGNDGLPIKTPVNKLDATASIYKRKPGMVMKTNKSSGSLEWVGKAKNSTAHFSKG